MLVAFTFVTSPTIPGYINTYKRCEKKIKWKFFTVLTTNIFIIKMIKYYGILPGKSFVISMVCVCVRYVYIRVSGKLFQFHRENEKSTVFADSLFEQEYYKRIKMKIQLNTSSKNVNVNVVLNSMWTLNSGKIKQNSIIIRSRLKHTYKWFCNVDAYRR